MSGVKGTTVERLMPEPKFRAQGTMQTSIDFLMTARDEGMAASGHFAPDQTWLMGFIIPPFQRPVVWTEDQMVRFVANAWDGYPLTPFVYNDLAGVTWRGKGTSSQIYHPFDRWLIDGQQRLTALSRYLDDQFKVMGYFWSELTRADQRRFAWVGFPSIQLRMTDEDELRGHYDDLNFSGTAHLESQRASRKKGGAA